MRDNRKAITAVGVIAVATMFSACTTAVPAASGDSDVVLTVTDFYSPLDEFLGQAIWTNQEEHQRAVAEFAVRREELISQCMREAGFNYHPDINSNSFSIGTNAFDDVQPDDWEWVSQYGFGIVSGHRHRSGGPTGERDDDPNREYVESLSETARAEFELALNGPPDAFSSPDADWNEWMQTRGCTGQGIVQAISESPLFLETQEEFRPLFEARNAMTASIVEQPAMVELTSEWAHCMADAGHPGLGRRSDATSPFWTQLFTTQVMIQVRADAGTPDPDNGAALLAELQAREIEMALSDLDCRIATNYFAREDAIRIELETQFVNDNRALLEDFRNAAELAG